MAFPTISSLDILESWSARFPAAKNVTTSLVRAATCGQGLTLVHFTAQRVHRLSHVLGCFAGFSDKNSSG